MQVMYLHWLYCDYILITVVATLYTHLNAVKIAATILVSSPLLSCTTICQFQEGDRYEVHVLINVCREFSLLLRQEYSLVPRPAQLFITCNMKWGKAA